MKKKIDKAAFDKLSDELKALYTLVGKDYVLQLEDDNDETPPREDETGPSGAKLALERKHRKAAEKRANDAETALETLQGEKETSSNTVATMKASHDKKVAKLEKERDDAILLHKNYVGGKLMDEAANTIAGKLTKSPKLLMPHLTARLAVDYDGDTPTVVVLDAKGAKSAATLEDLTKEFRDNKDFAGIVTASQASGGGASRPGVTAPVGSAPASGNQHQQQNVSLTKMSPAELAAEVKARAAARQAAAAA